MATKANLVVDQGATFSAVLNLTDENSDPLLLSGYTANSQIRKWYTSSNAVTFATEIDANAATITLTLSANQTSSMTAGRYVYDVKLTDNAANTVSRVVEGIVTVTPKVTS
jgi:hypothetical protein